MLINGRTGSPPLEIPEPKGITVSVKKAAEILGVSSATLKRRAPEWGLTIFWDGRGRRFSPRELREAQEGLLEPRKQTATQNLDALYGYEMPGGYRFRVYRTDEGKGYVGLFIFENLRHVRNTLQDELGAGIYYLKLLDENNRMTGHNFTVSVGAPNDPERVDKLEELRELKETKRYAKNPETFLEKWALQKMREVYGGKYIDYPENQK